MLNGGAENAGRENDGRENDGPMCRAWNSRTWNHWTRKSTIWNWLRCDKRLRLNRLSRFSSPFPPRYPATTPIRKISKIKVIRRLEHAHAVRHFHVQHFQSTLLNQQLVCNKSVLCTVVLWYRSIAMTKRACSPVILCLNEAELLLDSVTRLGDSELERLTGRLMRTLQWTTHNNTNNNNNISICIAK